ncbi:MAG: hypothetical protein IH891_10005 [Planctomycetes bacterium]|nr:hypothetical protein [Planctomycetota bacterium]
MPVQVPEQARCLTCGYLLRELDEPVCPECARRFDPEDPKTYNTDPPGRLRRRLIMWAIILLLIGGVGYALWPQQILTAQMTFTMKDSGHKITFRRWELLAPNWMPLTYPSFHWRSDTKGNASPGVDEPFSFHVKAKYLQGWSNTFDGKVIDVNGIIADPDHANEIMKALLAPSNRGISIGPLKPESVAESSGQDE